MPLPYSLYFFGLWRTPDWPSGADGSWEIPPVFGWLQKLGSIEQAEMDRVFNMGVGMVLIVSPHFVDSIMHQLREHGMQSWKIGSATAVDDGSDRVVVSKA